MSESESVQECASCSYIKLSNSSNLFTVKLIKKKFAEKFFPSTRGSP